MIRSVYVNRWWCLVYGVWYVLTTYLPNTKEYEVLSTCEDCLLTRSKVFVLHFIRDINCIYCWQKLTV